MPGNLSVPSDSIWGTQNALPLEEEVAVAAHRRTVAKNTAYLMFRPQVLFGTASVTSGEVGSYRMMHAGTFTVHVIGTFDCDDAWPSAEGTIAVNGTDIYTKTLDGRDGPIEFDETLTGVILPDGKIYIKIWADDSGGSGRYDAWFTDVFVRVMQKRGGGFADYAPVP